MCTYTVYIKLTLLSKNITTLLIDHFIGLGMPEDEDALDSDEDNIDESDDREEAVTLRKSGNGITDENDDYVSDEGVDDDDDYDDDDDINNDEKGGIHSASDSNNEERFSGSGDDLDASDDDDDDDDDDNDNVEEDEGMSDSDIQRFSTTSLKEDIEKGTAAKHQLSKLV